MLEYSAYNNYSIYNGLSIYDEGGSVPPVNPFNPPPNPEEFFAIAGYVGTNLPPNPEEFFAIIGAK